ncbi:hypothetical protein K438DRAFT_1955564 [Mycena galopus ATCC 62051]|nr:hypothetical protein K438DRAFT_1955564 [Mycena galopus ATCC 62051]
MSEINVLLSNATHPMSTITLWTHPRGSGLGHRHRYSAAPTRSLRSLVYETIQEERASPRPSPAELHRAFRVINIALRILELSRRHALPQEAENIIAWATILGPPPL